MKGKIIGALLMVMAIAGTAAATSRAERLQGIGDTATEGRSFRRRSARSLRQ